MIKSLLSKTAWIAFLLAFGLSFFGAKVRAEVASGSAETVQKYGISFPVEELGNCSDLKECRSFCDDPLNKDACVAFAKKKGFYKQSLLTNVGKANILINARQELGCESEPACKVFCSEQSNWQKCGEFAKKHSLGGGQVKDPGKRDILDKAKETLGCDSVEGCKGFCTKQDNQQRCDEFAKLVGLRGGALKKGPGGCTSLETCKAFCQDPSNIEQCSKAGVKVATSSGGISKEEYCRQYPDRCKNAEYASKCVNYGCTWTGTSCNCVNKTPFPGYSPKPFYTPVPVNYESYCKEKGGTWNGTNCIFATPSTAGNIGTTSSVKGISTIRSFFQPFIDFLGK